MSGGGADGGFADRLAAALAPQYELRELLGRGGFGEVYAAWDAELRREVAIKTLRPDVASQEDVVRRFRREAESAARLRHPCIVPVFSVGERDGIAWFVMPRVHGESLRDWLRREPQPPLGEVRRILADVAGALLAAHEAGVVHRDVKPDNILLEGDDRRVLVTDFGIAKALDTADTGLTATGIAVGSPDYMSPEQAAGESVDHRADIYSLGVVGFEMVAGQLPFGEGTVATVLVRHATRAAPSLLDLRPACPSHLAAAIARCLEKSPAARWPSMVDLREALVDSRADLSAAAAEPARAGPARGPLLRTLGYAAAVLVALVIDVVGGGPWSASPIVVTAAVLAAAIEWTTLGVRGSDWRHPFRRAAGVAARQSVPTPAATARFGPWAVVVGRALADRVAVRGVVARLPRAERGEIEELLPVLDRLTAEAADAAEQLAALERRQGGSHEDHAAQRRELSARLDRAAGTVGALRRAVRSADADGVARIREDVARLTLGLDHAAAGRDGNGDQQARHGRDR